MALHESGQMYLETIYVLSQQHARVRAIDVAEELGFSKPSVSRALGILKRGGYVESDETGSLSLTEAGLEVAKMIYDRHEMLTKLLTKLGVSVETATEDACRMEHVISHESFEAMRRFAEE